MWQRHSRHLSPELWQKVVLRKWMNISNVNSDYGADSDSDNDGNDNNNDNGNGINEDANNCSDDEDIIRRLRRQKSETFRAQYISKKDLRVCVGTWNVGGRVPSDDLDIEEWLNISEPSDIYVLGLQEIVPLNAGNIFGKEDNRPVLKWENIIRETLSKVQPGKKTYKSYSAPTSPSQFKPLDDIEDLEDDILLECDTENPNGFYEFKDIATIGDGISNNDGETLPCFLSGLGGEVDKPIRTQSGMKLITTLSEKELISLSWPEPPLNLVGQIEKSCLLQTAKSLPLPKLLKAYSKNKGLLTNGPRVMWGVDALAKLDLEALILRRRRPEYVRIVSKQMVGVFLTIWVRRHLRKHIQNLKVSTVGVGVMGYIGNKGSVSVSMSIYQTLFCFICTHLTSGDKQVDQLKRNADVLEIHRRTIFQTDSGFGLPKSIQDHEKIFWLGDLNYRISLPYEKTRQLISKEEWSQLVEKDQLVREMKEGHVFDGWSEGVLNFPPTYKYVMNSDKYSGADPKAGRRTPAWCDRILSFGKCIKLLLGYRRSELKLSDHRPVTAIYDVEVEVFSLERLQRFLTLTTTEVKNIDFLVDEDPIY